MVLYKDIKKKEYAAPVFEAEEFTVDCVISTSTQDGHEGGIDSVEDPDSLIDSVIIDGDTKDVKAFLDENSDVILEEDLDSVY